MFRQWLPFLFKKGLSFNFLSLLFHFCSLLLLFGPNLFCLAHPYSNPNLGFFYPLFCPLFFPPSEEGMKSRLRMVQTLGYKGPGGNLMLGSPDFKGMEPLTSRGSLRGLRQWDFWSNIAWLVKSVYVLGPDTVRDEVDPLVEKESWSILSHVSSYGVTD